MPSVRLTKALSRRRISTATAGSLEPSTFTSRISWFSPSTGDGTVTLEEFLGWDPGYVYAAGKINKVEAVEEAKEDIFKELDLNEDGTVDHSEMSAASLYFFYRADVDQSRALDQKEFTEEFRILKTMRAAFE
jgi:Ca2+-binding EF-hand superfamily protein